MKNDNRGKSLLTKCVMSFTALFNLIYINRCLIFSRNFTVVQCSWSSLSVRLNIIIFSVRLYISPMQGQWQTKKKVKVIDKVIIPSPTCMSLCNLKLRNIVNSCHTSFIAKRSATDLNTRITGPSDGTTKPRSNVTVGVAP